MDMDMDEMSLRTAVSCRRCDSADRPRLPTATFGHITRLADDVPAHQVLKCHVDTSIGRPPSRLWTHRPGCPRNIWLRSTPPELQSFPIKEWRLGLHQISYPAPAEIRPNFHIRPYPTPVGYGRWIWGQIWPSFDASASTCNWAGIHCFKNSVICTSLFHHRHVDHTHILVSVCISLLVTQSRNHVMWCSLGLQLKNIWLHPWPRPDLQSQIRCNPSGDTQFVEVMVLEWHSGPRQLCNTDDDYDSSPSSLSMTPWLSCQFLTTSMIHHVVLLDSWPMIFVSSQLKTWFSRS